MKTILRYINNLPFKFTITHLYPLPVALDSAESWNVLRTSHPHFITSDIRNEWVDSLTQIRDGQDANMPERAHDVANLIREKHFQSLHSLGVGSAGLEYYILKELPDLNLKISEYNPESVRILNSVFPEANPTYFDIHISSWAADLSSSHLVMIYRMDPQLSNKEWRAAFQRMYDSQVKNILYIPSKFLSIRNLIDELNMREQAIMKGQILSFAGYKRTQKVFESYWKNLYDAKLIQIGRLKGYLLHYN